jgi:hypothetical protein
LMSWNHDSKMIGAQQLEVTPTAQKILQFPRRNPAKIP